MENVPILINTCDAYLDVLEVQLELLAEKGYLSDEGRIYINTENQVLQKYSNSESIIFHQNGTFGWGQRVRKSLEKIDSARIILLFDDYFPDLNFSSGRYFDFIEEIIDRGADCCYLIPILIKDGEGSGGGLVRISDLRPYRLNSAAAVWSRDALLRVLKDTDDPWVWEAFGGYRKEARCLSIWSVSREAPFRFEYSASTGGAVYRGTWVGQVLEQHNLIDHKIIKTSGRPVLHVQNAVKRTLSWKLKFLVRGFRISPLGLVRFALHAVMKKFGRD